jgi:hypothetical protein
MRVKNIAERIFLKDALNSMKQIYHLKFLKSEARIYFDVSNLQFIYILCFILAVFVVVIKTRVFEGDFELIVCRRFPP